MLQETVEPEGSPEGQKEPRYKLDPEYQRRHRWSNVRKSRLIESFLMNVPVPPVFLYERDLARFEVMDGRQRLTALSEFYSNKFSLTGLEYWPELEGRTYSSLPSKIRDGIDRRYISSIILLKETAATPEQAATLKKIVFERLNSGGVELTGQETRNAVYDGPLNQLCLRLSENPDFKKLWGIPSSVDPEDTEDESSSPDDSTSVGRRMFEKMEDVEMVLRFFAYRQLESFPAGLNKISALLDRFLIEGNKFPESVLTSYRTLFESTVSFLQNALGPEAFAAIDRPRSRPTKLVYDPIMYVASAATAVERETLTANKAVLRSKLVEMYRVHHELFAGRRTNLADSQLRNKIVAEAFRAAIAASQ